MNMFQATKKALIQKNHEEDVKYAPTIQNEVHYQANFTIQALALRLGHELCQYNMKKASSFDAKLQNFKICYKGSVEALFDVSLQRKTKPQQIYFVSSSQKRLTFDQKRTLELGVSITEESFNENSNLNQLLRFCDLNFDSERQSLLCFKNLNYEEIARQLYHFDRFLIMGSLQIPYFQQDYLSYIKARYHRFIQSQIKSSSKQMQTIKMQQKGGQIKPLLDAQLQGLQKQLSFEGSKLQEVYNLSETHNQTYCIENQQYQQSEKKWHLAQLKEMNTELRKRNIFAFKLIWRKQTQKFLLSLIQNFEVLGYELSQSLLQFVKLNEYKMFNLGFSLNNWLYNSQQSLYEVIYPGLTYVVNALLKKLQVQSFLQQREKFKKNLVFLIDWENQSEGNKQIDGLFLEEMRRKYEIEKETALQSDIYKLYKECIWAIKNDEVTTNNRLLKSLETYLAQQIAETSKLLRNNLLSQKIQQSITSFFSQLIQQNANRPHSFGQTTKESYISRVYQPKCLGCSHYFIENCPIYRHDVSQIPFKVFPSIMKLKDHQVELKDTICSMLNSGGGIILFNCEQIKHSIYAKGQYLTQKQKQGIQQSISSYFRWIHPRPEININIKISFVPILLNKSASKLNFGDQQSLITVNHNQKLVQTDFLQGMYVTRLIITPKEGLSVYFWYYSHKQSAKDYKQTVTMMFCSTLDDQNNPSPLKIGQMRRLMKRKFKENYVSSESGISQLLMQKPVSVFGHECDDPEKGYQVMREVIKERKNRPQFCEYQKKNTETITSLEQKYTNMTLLFAKKSDLPRIEQTMRECGVECEIQQSCSKYKLKGLGNSSIIYHQKSFEMVHQLIVNDWCFRFSTSKAFTVVSVTKHLRFQLRNEKKPLENSQIMKYMKLLQNEFQGESAMFYQCHIGPKKVEYYLSTSNSLSLFFMYFSLNQMEQKVSLRNPPNSSSLHCKKIEISQKRCEK